MQHYLEITRAINLGQLKTNETKINCVSNFQGDFAFNKPLIGEPGMWSWEPDLCRGTADCWFPMFIYHTIIIFRGAN